MSLEQRLVLSGASGAIGWALLSRLLEDGVDQTTELVALFSSTTSLESMRRRLGEMASRVCTLVCDLTDQQSVERAVRQLRPARRCIGVHAAAGVSWSAPSEQLWPLNVDGAGRFAHLLTRAGAKSRLVYVGSSYALVKDREFRNGYEHTKAAGAELVRERFPELETTVFACSLVAGNSKTGEISRFHGIYPFVYAIDAWEPPLLACENGVTVDIVPIDWVIEELMATLRDVQGGASRLDVNAASGTRSESFQTIVGMVWSSLNQLRGEAGHPLIQEIAIAPERRVSFLRRAAKTWGVGTELDAKATRVEKLLRAYQPYLKPTSSAPPAGVRTEAPKLDTYIDHCVRYWALHGAGVTLRKQRLRRSLGDDAHVG